MFKLSSLDLHGWKAAQCGPCRRFVRDYVYAGGRLLAAVMPGVPAVRVALATTTAISAPA